MAIKNKDGTPYRLASPNPVMKTQVLWGSEKFILHNMKWSGEIYQDTIKSEKPTRTQSFLSDLEETKVIETPVKIEPKEESTSTVYEAKVEVHEDKKRIEEEEKSEIEKIFIHLLPATYKTKVDDLYGDVKKTVYYGQPTSFEAVEIEMQDFYFKIWTELDIGIGSILYPKTNYKRWWKVQSKEKKANGWLITCMPSDHQPSFPS